MHRTARLVQILLAVQAFAGSSGYCSSTMERLYSFLVLAYAISFICTTNGFVDFSGSGSEFNADNEDGDNPIADTCAPVVNPNPLIMTSRATAEHPQLSARCTSACLDYLNLNVRVYATCTYMHGIM